MELKIYTKDLEVDPEAHRYIQKKFKRLSRHLKALSDAKLELSRTSARAQADRVVAQMTLSADGYIIRGQERASTLFAAIDAVTDVVDGQIERYKGKVYRTEQARRSARAGLDRGPASPDQPIEGSDPEPDDSDSPRVVRTKRVTTRSMSMEDAIIEMELVGHSFFLFNNVDTGEYSVVYRRHEGDYGLIEPDAA